MYRHEMIIGIEILNQIRMICIPNSISTGTTLGNPRSKIPVKNLIFLDLWIPLQRVETIKM